MTSQDSQLLAMAANLHRQALTLLAQSAGVHLSGLQQGVRMKHLGLSGPMRKKLRNLELGLAVLRHITVPGCSEFLVQLRMELSLAREEGPFVHEAVIATSVEAVAQDPLLKAEAVAFPMEQDLAGEEAAEEPARDEAMEQTWETPELAFEDQGAEAEDAEERTKDMHAEGAAERTAEAEAAVSSVAAETEPHHDLGRDLGVNTLEYQPDLPKRGKKKKKAAARSDEDALLESAAREAAAEEQRLHNLWLPVTEGLQRAIDKYHGVCPRGHPLKACRVGAGQACDVCRKASAVLTVGAVCTHKKCAFLTCCQGDGCAPKFVSITYRVLMKQFPQCQGALEGSGHEGPAPCPAGAAV